MVPAEALRGLAGVALFAAPGAGLAELLPAVRALPPARRLAHAYLLGIAWTAGWLYALSHWLAVPLRSPAVLAVAGVPVVVGVVSWIRRRREKSTVSPSKPHPRPLSRGERGDLAERVEPVAGAVRTVDVPEDTQRAPHGNPARLSPPSPPGRGAGGEASEGKPSEKRARPRRLVGSLALAAGALVSLALLCEALDNPLTDWDGRMTWAAQARYMRSEGTVHPTALIERGWYVAHPWYPLLMPVAQVAVLELTGADVDHHAFRPMYAVFFPVWLLLIYGGAETLAGRAAAGWTALCAALLSFPAFAGAGGAASAYSDLPLACFFGGGLLLLLAARPRWSAALAGGILLAAAVLTKAEGEIFAPAALGLAALYHLSRWRRRWRALALAALPVALALILLLSWRARIPESFESFEQATSLSLLWPGIVTRIPQLAGDARTEMVFFPDWGLFWSVAPLVLIAGWRGLRRKPALPLLLAAAVPLGVGWVYATMSLRPDFVVKTTWNRFLLQASVPLLVLFALGLRDLLRRAPWVPWALGGRGIRGWRATAAGSLPPASPAVSGAGSPDPSGGGS